MKLANAENDQTQRPDRDRKGKDRQRNEERAAPRIGGNVLAIGHKTDDRHRNAERRATARRTCGARSRLRTKIRACPADRSMPTSANSAMATIASPPTKSCGPRIHFGMMYLTGTWLGVSLIDLSPPQGLSPILFLDGPDAGPAILPTDFRQITPAKPKHPPASNIQSGLSRVAKASTAAATVISGGDPGPVRGLAPKSGRWRPSIRSKAEPAPPG